MGLAQFPAVFIGVSPDVRQESSILGSLRCVFIAILPAQVHDFPLLEVNVILGIISLGEKLASLGLQFLSAAGSPRLPVAYHTSPV